MQAPAGYLYACVIGYVPTGEDTACLTGYDALNMRLHVKLGSLRTDDPLGAVRDAYSRALGAPRLLWLEASANAYHDEHRELFTALDRFRVWPRHEVFAFDSEAHALQMLANFTAIFRQRTAEQEKPPHVPARAAPVPTAAEAKIEREERETERQEALARARERRDEQRRLDAEAEEARCEERINKRQARRQERDDQLSAKRAEEATQLQALDDFIADHCTLDPAGHIHEKDLKARGPHVPGGIKPLMERKAFTRRQVYVDGVRKWAYRGLAWRQQ